MSGQLNAGGGVSPFKRRTSKTKAGKVGIKATATKAQDKSGYSRSGAEGVNTPSFTPNTRVTPSLVNSLDVPKAAASGKANNSNKVQIGTDAGGNPIYNYYYGDVDKSKTSTINIDQQNIAGGGTSSSTGKKYPTKDQVCHKDYPAAHDGKGGPGSQECKDYRAYRKKNPKKRGGSENGDKIDQKNIIEKIIVDQSD